jgi:N-acylglucosamine-6-phosphate 2-epimerase
LSGYTSYTRRRRFPDIALIKQLAKRLKVPVIAEGGYYSPEEAVRAIRAGAYAVVVGTAITRPQKIAEGFSEEIKKALKVRR